MEKRVGRKTFIFLFFCFFHFLYASDPTIILRIQDMNHEPIDQAMCQAPFILQVELKNIEGYTDVHLMQYITGIENFKASRSMTSHNESINNGKKTTKVFYNFVLRADKKGVFTIGPVLLPDKYGQKIKSNRLVVRVGDEIISSDKVAKDKYFITMNLNKKQAYVGEKLTLNIKFYDRLFVDDLQLQFPDFKNFYLVKNKNHFRKSMIQIKDEEYSVSEWNFDVYATQPGTLFIQDINAAFFAPELESKFKFGGSFDFFRSLHKSQQYVIANPVKAEILPLPESEEFKNVVSVGQFSKFTISLNKNSVAAGEGVILTTELFGDANFEMIPSIPFVLPEGFRYYDANTVTIDEKRSLKHYEFIVQADIEGNYIIPSQKFVYFDPADSQYKILKSNAIELTITPAEQSLQSLQNVEEPLDQNLQNDEPRPLELKDFKPYTSGNFHAQPVVMIPLSYYKQILWFLLWLYVCLVLYRIITQRFLFQHTLWKNFIIFYQAKFACSLASSKNEIHRLHTIFIRLFSQLLGINSGQLHDEMLVQYLKDKNFSHEQLQDWKNFYDQILYASFSSKSYEQLQEKVDQKALFIQALQWIEQLKEKA